MRTCSVEDCENEHSAKGYCKKHYKRWVNKGSPTARITRDPNEYVDCGTYYEIKLYNIKGDYIASAKIDSEDVEKCKQYKWRLSSNGYAVSGDESTRIWLHKFVMNADSSIQVDHKYGVTLDDRKSQLRECNQAQNTQNQKLSRVNTSGEKNVSWSKQAGKWLVMIRAFGKKYYFGYYSNYDQACQVARTERQQLHSEFARDA